MLHAFGDVDMSSAPQFEKAIEAAATGRSRLLLDLTQCHYLDSSGLAVLARAGSRFGVKLTLVVRPQSNVLRVIRLVGFDRVFNIVTDLPRSADTARSDALLDVRIPRRPLSITPQGSAALATLDDDFVLEKSDAELEASPLGIARLDRSGRVAFVNEAERTFLNLHGVDLIGLPYFEDVTPFAAVKAFGKHFPEFLNASHVRSETIGFSVPDGWSYKEAKVVVVKGLDDDARIYVVTSVTGPWSARAPASSAR